MLSLRKNFPWTTNCPFLNVPMWILKIVLQLRHAITCYFKQIIIIVTIIFSCHSHNAVFGCQISKLNPLLSGCDILSCSSGWALRLPGQLDLLLVIHPLCFHICCNVQQGSHGSNKLFPSWRSLAVHYRFWQSAIAGYLSQYKICLLPGFGKQPEHQKKAN